MTLWSVVVIYLMKVWPGSSFGPGVGALAGGVLELGTSRRGGRRSHQLLPEAVGTSFWSSGRTDERLRVLGSWPDWPMLFSRAISAS